MAVPGRKGQTKLTSTISVGSEEDIQLFCQPCDRNGPRRPAFGYCTDCEDHLCQSCFNGHRNVKPCRNHTLLNKDTMPKSQKLSSASSSTSQSEELTKPCPRHRKKMIEFYCHDHKSLLCSVCVTLEHTRSSCNVNYIPDISDQTLDSTEYKDTIKSMDILLTKCQKVETETRRVTENSNSSLSSVLREMKKYRREINEIFDEMEKEIENEADSLKQENDSRQKTAETLCDDMFKSMNILYGTIKQLNKSRQEEKLFVELKSAQEVLQNNESCINDLSNVSNIAAYDFESNKTIVKCIEKERSLGTIRQKQERNSAPAKQTSKKSQASSSRNLQHSHEGEINVETSEDKKSCWITGMTLLSSNHLVLADNDNECIKFVDVNSKQIIYRLPLPSKPWDITTVSSTEIVTTLPDEQKIQFTSVSSNIFRETHRLKVDGECRGISYYQQKLVVTYIDPGKLQIIDMKGTVLTDICTTASGEHIFSSPYYVAVNSKSIYVSDHEFLCSNVTMFDWKGEVTANYENLVVAKGLALTERGTLYVCDNDNDYIRELSEDCTKGNVVANDLTNPYAVCCSKDMHTLYISSDSETGNCCDFIKVIEMV